MVNLSSSRRTPAPVAPQWEDPLYPSCDGNPMSDNTEQYQWIVLIAENLRALFADDPHIFIAADLLWYAVQHKNKVEGEPIAQAPDVMVTFGRPAGFRMSYKQWEEEDLAPQVVWEILSDSNKTERGRRDLAKKFEFYQRHGVEEYYQYDPLDLVLKGWLREGDRLREIPQFTPWISPHLGIRLLWQPGQKLQLFTPDQQPFISFSDLNRERLQAQDQVSQARLAQERERLEKERERLEKERLADYLRSLGLDPDNLPPAG